MDIVVDVFNRETGKTLTSDDIVVYDVGESYGIEKELASTIWKENHKEIINRCIPIWDLDEFMGKWETYGLTGSKRNEIIIVTARPEESRADTISWLKRNKVEYDEIYFGYGNKIDAVREHSLDVMVDDRAEAIQEIDREDSLGCTGYVVDQPYNRWYGTMNRVYTKGILNKV